MTVYFTLDSVSFCVHGVKHEAAGKPHFEVRHVFIQGHSADIKKMLSADFLERVAEAAAEAAEDDVPFGGPQKLAAEFSDEEIEMLR